MARTLEIQRRLTKSNHWSTLEDYPLSDRDFAEQRLAKLQCRAGFFRLVEVLSIPACDGVNVY